MSTPTYIELVSETFMNTPTETFGDAHATTAELSSLRQLFTEQGTRQATLESIHENGYPLPDEITPEMVAITGASHACGVALHLAETRGVEGKDSTFESYTAKNRFDRFTSLHLPVELQSAWKSPVQRENGLENPNISYPNGVDTSFIYGVAKPSRYLPAQTIRHLEFARLGKLDESTKETMMITDEPLDKFKIDWNKLVPIIESATDTVQLAGDIGAGIAKQLLENGLPTEKVVAILKKSYSIRGIKEEHGNIPEADGVQEALVKALDASVETSELATQLK